MTLLDQIKEPIRNELIDFENSFQQVMKSDVPLLNLVTKYLLKRKGKQLRPLLVFLTARLLGPVSRSTHIAASLIEILHTATLIHDDVVDESYERRGFFSINAIWKTKIAVLLGDYLLAKGLLLSVNSREYELLEIVSEAVKEMSEGELLQIKESRKLSISESQYFEIIRKKTAALIKACTACGAKSVQASEIDIRKLAFFGENLGIAFQIRDDLLDYQNTGITGKPTGNDIKQKKITLPLINSLQNASLTHRKSILSTINKGKVNVKEFNGIINFVTSMGGIEYSNKVMNEYIQKALSILDQFPNNQARQSLKSLVEYTAKRKQ